MSATEGQPAPALDLPTDGGGRVTLAALQGAADELEDRLEGIAAE